MKNWIKWLTVFILVIPMGIGLAQTKPTGLKGTPQTTPVIHSGTGGSTQGIASNSNVHSVNVRLRQQMRQVRKDLKAGKITKDQAKAAWEKFKGIRVQELQFFKQNGQKEITADQKNQLNAILDKNTGN
jgi:hypothetical protein